MKDIKDDKKEWKEFEKADDRRSRALSDRRVEKEVERLRAIDAKEPHRGSRPKDKLRRLERISERDSRRHFCDFDPKKVQRLEDKEIGDNPRGVIRKHQGEGLDDATEYELRKSLKRRNWK